MRIVYLLERIRTLAGEEIIGNFLSGRAGAKIGGDVTGAAGFCVRTLWRRTTCATPTANCQACYLVLELALVEAPVPKPDAAAVVISCTAMPPSKLALLLFVLMAASGVSQARPPIEKFNQARASGVTELMARSFSVQTDLLKQTWFIKL